MSEYKNERDVAISAVLKASVLCQHVQQQMSASSTVNKRDKSPVTIADFGTQALVSELLHSSFPHIPLVGEEDSTELQANEALCQRMMDTFGQLNIHLDRDSALRAIDRGTHTGGASGQHWTLDPIDGTKGFLRGDQYAIALALIENGEVVLGVLGCPNLYWPDNSDEKGALFVAVQGQGAFVRKLDGGDTEYPVSVKELSALSEANFCESVEAAHSSHSDSARIASLLNIRTSPYRIDSQCKYAAVARGDAAIYLRLPTKPGYVEKIWDHAAGVCVIEEAGGKVTDVHGNDLDFSLGRRLENNKGVVVSNGQFHEDVLRAVQNVLGI